MCERVTCSENWLTAIIWIIAACRKLVCSYQRVGGHCQVSLMSCKQSANLPSGAWVPWRSINWSNYHFIAHKNTADPSHSPYQLSDHSGTFSMFSLDACNWHQTITTCWCIRHLQLKSLEPMSVPNESQTGKEFVYLLCPTYWPSAANKIICIKL